MNFQEAAHGADHDYVKGSPHLAHARLRAKVVTSLRSAVADSERPHEQVRVLEVGAGHGRFTAVLRGSGARVTATEMSGPSARKLGRLYEGDPFVEVIHDEDGSWVHDTDKQFDVVACLSVLHHIPDYLSAIDQYARVTSPGGTFVSWQDPIAYDHLPKPHRIAAVSAYYGWRVFQGNWRSGARTLGRRLRGTLDQLEQADMVEYHVVRGGVDEEAITQLLSRKYESVEVEEYWSTQARYLQYVGEMLSIRSTFAIIGRGRL